MILNNADPSNFQENQKPLRTNQSHFPYNIWMYFIFSWYYKLCTRKQIVVLNWRDSKLICWIISIHFLWNMIRNPNWAEKWKYKNCKTRNENVKSNPFWQPPLLKINLNIFKPTSDTFFTFLLLHHSVFHFLVFHSSNLLHSLHYVTYIVSLLSFS